IASPARLLRGDVSQGGLLQRHCACLGGPPLPFRVTLGLQWVYAIEKLPARLIPSVTDFCQRQQVVWSKTHVVALVVASISEHPALCALLGNCRYTFWPTAYLPRRVSWARSLADGYRRIAVLLHQQMEDGTKAY